MPQTVYDVTTWTIPGQPSVTAYNDIGAIINDIIRQIKVDQPNQAAKPGAVIYIPPGDYSLKTRVVVDVSYLQIKGSGHGFMSVSIRHNSNASGWHEINPGASHIKVENTDGTAEAFLVTRSGSPRLGSVEFRDFCLDGMNFTPHQNSYRNGKIGIRCATANDSFRIEGMGFVYLERAIIVHQADALNITNNFICECGSCVELTGHGYASKVTNNHIGAGYVGYSIFAEGHGGLLIAGNNIFPRGASVVHLKGTSRSSITGNRFHNFYPGMVVMQGTNSENLVASNHFLRVRETWAPMQGYDNGRDDLYGLVHVRGNDNMVTTNLFKYDVASQYITPTGATPTMILVAAGARNFISNNSFVPNLAVNTVVLDASTTQTKILDSGTASQILAYTTDYTVRLTP